jgi:ABC-type phosphate transport system permease subunit
MVTVYQRRRASNFVAMALCYAATAVSLTVLAAILWTLFSHGIEAIRF